MRLRGLILLLLALLGVLALCPSLLGALPEVCWFHRYTGLPCPGCGMTRSVLLSLRGEFREALRLHPMGPLALAVALGLGGMLLLPRAWREVVARRGMAWEQRLPWVYYGLLLGWLAFGIVRLVLTWAGLVARI